MSVASRGVIDSVTAVCVCAREKGRYRDAYWATIAGSAAAAAIFDGFDSTILSGLGSDMAISRLSIDFSRVIVKASVCAESCVRFSAVIFLEKPKAFFATSG